MIEVSNEDDDEAHSAEDDSGASAAKRRRMNCSTCIHSVREVLLTEYSWSNDFSGRIEIEEISLRLPFYERDLLISHLKQILGKRVSTEEETGKLFLKGLHKKESFLQAMSKAIKSVASFFVRKIK